AYLATLDDDEEALQDVVSNYSLYDEFDAPVSFVELPIRWSNRESSYDHKNRIYLRGTSNNGLQRLHKQVKAWKYESLKEKPDISVLSKNNVWIKLQQPRKSYENMIRTILITVHYLHFFKRKPEASSSSLWNNLCEVFRKPEASSSSLWNNLCEVFRQALCLNLQGKSIALACKASPLP
nr:protein enhanced downy mildew 2-like [Tanacetum cinerariifolium]